MPCSAAEIQYASIALTWAGSASPRQRIRKRSGIDVRLVDLALRDRRAAGAARGLRDERERHHRRAREVVARLGVVDVDQRLEAPLRAEHRERGLDVDARVAGADRERVRLGGRQPGLERPVDEQAPDLLERDVADELLDVDAAVAQRAALRSGSAISVAKATTPSRPDWTSLMAASLRAASAGPSARRTRNGLEC